MKIKTLIAAGGLGKRLQGYRGNESTKVLLEVNNTPMIKLQIQKLIEWGLEDFVIITNPQYDQLIKDVTSSIEGINIDYVAQNEPKGISHAFLQAENKINNDEAIVCVLGDNFFGENLLNDVNFENFVQNQNSLIFTKEVNNPEEFGVA
jgi:glucose-1-phosphate thymidylyltransferase